MKTTPQSNHPSLAKKRGHSPESRFFSILYFGVFLLTALPVTARAGTETFDFTLGEDHGFTTSQLVNPNGTLWSYSGTSWSVGSTTSATSELISPALILSGGNVTVSFSHAFYFETNWDGGILEASLNGGAFGQVLSGAFTVNGYNNTSGNSSSPLGPVHKFSGGPQGPQTSTADLGSGFASGDTLQLRWRAGWDSSVLRPSPNWELFLVSVSGVLMGPPPEELSATTTGLPMANVESQMLIGAGQTVTNDVNNHLFNLIAGDGEEAANDGLAAAMDDDVIVGQGDGPEDPIARKGLRSRQWEVFTTVNYGNVNLRSIGAQAGVQIDAWAPGVGIGRHLSRGLAVGFAASFLTSDQNYTGGLGSLHLEGPALSAYLTFVRKNFWNSLLYSFGTYELDSTRNPGFGFPQAFGTTRTYTNSVQYNTGWNFRFQNNTLVTGPFAGIDYLHGSVDAYNETGGGLAALRYNKQSFESLVTRVGWAASKKIKTSWATITPQVRLSYERQNLKNNGTSVSLINAPFTATGGNQSPGQDYMVLGTGVNFQFNDQCSLMLGYQAQFFRQDQQAHFGSVRIGWKF